MTRRRPSAGARSPADVALSYGSSTRGGRSHLADPRPGAALVIDRRHPARLERCTIVGRRTPHIRHWHKHFDGTLPEPQRFYFRDGAVAANITEFHRHVRFCDPSVIDYHAGRGDFSRWISDVLQDRDLAARRWWRQG